MMAHRGAREQVLTGLPGELARRLDLLEQAERDLHEIVRDLVLAGNSWAAVARMMGVSRQAVRQRFGRDVEAWRAEHGDEMPWDGDWFESDPDPYAYEKSMIAMLSADQ